MGYLTGATGATGAQAIHVEKCQWPFGATTHGEAAGAGCTRRRFSGCRLRGTRLARRVGACWGW